MQYLYDNNNRKVRETRLNVEVGTLDGTTQRQDLMTIYGYDGVGRQTILTDNRGNTAYTYYDALGRIRAVVAPARESVNTINGTATTPYASQHTTSYLPLTEYSRDAFGNVIVMTERLKGAANPGVDTYTLVGSDSGDRITKKLYDSRNQVIQTTNAAGTQLYTSYNELGLVAKEWFGVTLEDNITTVVRTKFEVRQYDKLGRVTHVITPASNTRFNASTQQVEWVSLSVAGMVDIETVYNQFGEVIRKGNEGTLEEFYEYDAAGNVWRTNSGEDRVDKVILYDLQGNVATIITSATADLRAISSAQQAQGLTGTNKVDYRYDFLNRQITQIQAARTTINGSERPIIVQTFDRWGNLTSVSDPRNVNWLTTYRYNANDQVTLESKPDATGGQSASSPKTHYFYDALGNQIAVRDANNNLNRQLYDAAGNLIEEWHADGGVVKHYYDAFGNESKRIDAMNQVTMYQYDALNHLTATIEDGVIPYSFVTGIGMPVLPRNTVTARQLINTMTYDEAGQLAKTVNGRLYFESAKNPLVYRPPKPSAIATILEATSPASPKTQRNNSPLQHLTNKTAKLLMWMTMATINSGRTTTLAA